MAGGRIRWLDVLSVLRGCTCVRSLYDDDERMGAEVSIAAYLCMWCYVCVLSATCTPYGSPAARGGLRGQANLERGLRGQANFDKIFARCARWHILNQILENP